MANTAFTAPKLEAVLNTTGVLTLPPAEGGIVSRYLIEFESSSFSGSITVKARRAGSITAFKAVPYTSLFLNAGVSSGGQLTTAITDSSLIEVDASGMELELDCTVASGSMAIGATPLLG